MNCDSDMKDLSHHLIHQQLHTFPIMIKLLIMSLIRDLLLDC